MKNQQDQGAYISTDSRACVASNAVPPMSAPTSVRVMTWHMCAVPNNLRVRRNGGVLSMTAHMKLCFWMFSALRLLPHTSPAVQQLASCYCIATCAFSWFAAMTLSSTAGSSSSEVMLPMISLAAFSNAIASPESKVPSDCGVASRCPACLACTWANIRFS